MLITEPAVAERASRHAAAQPSILRLDQGAKNVRMRIVDLQAQPLFGAQDERVSLRLKELGFLPGVVLKIIGFGLLGRDPVAVEINGTKFALRRAEASKVQVEVLDAVR